MSAYTWNCNISIYTVPSIASTPGAWTPFNIVESTNVISASKIIGEVNVTTSIGASRTASFTVLADLIASPYNLIGKGVFISYTDSEGSNIKLFSGIIRSPAISIKNQTLTYTCSDNFKDRLALETILYPTSSVGVYVPYNDPRNNSELTVPLEPAVDFGSPIYTPLLQMLIDDGALYSKFVFGDVSTHSPQELFEAYLSTTLKDIAVDYDGIVSLLSLNTQSGISVKNFNESNIIYSSEPVQSDISTPAWAPVNEIICKVPYRFPNLAQRNYRYTYAHPGPVGARGSLAVGTNWLTKQAMEQAINATGLKIISATYVDQPASQTYTDAFGNVSVWVADELIRKDFIYTADLYLARRFTYDITHTMITYVRCPLSYGKYGLVSKTDTAAVDVKYDTAPWTASFQAPYTGSSLGEHSIQKTDITGYTQTDANLAMSCLVARATREILKANSKAGGGVGAQHVLKTTLRNAPHRIGYTGNISIPNLSATGLITAITYSMSMNSVPTATITISSQNLPPISNAPTLPSALTAIAIPSPSSGSTANGGPYTHDLPVYISGIDTYPGDGIEGHFTNSSTPVAGFPNEIRLIYNAVDTSSQSNVDTLHPVYVDYTLVEDTLIL